MWTNFNKSVIIYIEWSDKSAFHTKSIPLILFINDKIWMDVYDLI